MVVVVCILVISVTASSVSSLAVSLADSIPSRYDPNGPRPHGMDPPPPPDDDDDGDDGKIFLFFIG